MPTMPNLVFENFTFGAALTETTLTVASVFAGRVGTTARRAVTAGMVAVTTAPVVVSRPEMGLVTVAFALFNQHGICVVTQENAMMVARRSPAGRAGRAARDSTETRA